MDKRFFTREVLDSLPSDDQEALLVLYAEFKKLEHETRSEPPAKRVDDFIESLAILNAFSDHRELRCEIPRLVPDKNGNVQRISDHWDQNAVRWQSELNHRNAENLYSRKNSEYASFFEKAVVYEFIDEEFARVQHLIDELRQLISQSALITADHRRRLLLRLEAMQKELHKRTSDIDRFWGFIGEAGVVARKFGEDMKPISERVTELGRIVLAVIFAKEGIKALPPEVTKMLGPDK